MKYANTQLIEPTALLGVSRRRMPSAAEASATEARFGLRLSARLNERAQAVPHDISERLRVARENAVNHARAQAKTEAAKGNSVLNMGRVAALGGRGENAWWLKLTSMVPLLVLVVGFFVIQHLQGEEQILAAADVDVALLGDEVPPDAYADPGFGEFLKSGAGHSSPDAVSPAIGN